MSKNCHNDQYRSDKFPCGGCLCFCSQIFGGSQLVIQLFLFGVILFASFQCDGAQWWEREHQRMGAALPVKILAEHLLRIAQITTTVACRVAVEHFFILSSVGNT